MPWQAFALVVLAGLIHAGWNIVAKRTSGDARFAFFTSVVMGVVWAPLALWVGHESVPHWDWRAWTAVTVSGVVHVIYFVTLLRGYRKGDLTVVYPLARGSGPLLTSLLAITLLGERISLVAASGIVGIVLGVFFVAGGPALWRQGRDEASRNRLRAGVMYGLLTGVFIASYTFVDGYAVKVLLLSPILVDYMGNFVRLAVLAPTVLRDRAETVQLWRTQWRSAAIVGVFGPVAYVLVMYAMQMAPLSHVAPAREVSMLFAAVIGGHLLGESDRGVRIVGACAIALGVVALGLG
ncbi:EamA family transporter [Hydrogenophaga sp. 5NK40-0174]|uniref:EamA family transporter n=1 Tax=Hydrogenophaga sp. 5NK40-0174 TaxID=3127649 RepID=UPI0031045597